MKSLLNAKTLLFLVTASAALVALQSQSQSPPTQKILLPVTPEGLDLKKEPGLSLHRAAILGNELNIDFEFGAKLAPKETRSQRMVSEYQDLYPRPLKIIPVGWRVEGNKYKWQNALKNFEVPLSIDLETNNQAVVNPIQNYDAIQVELSTDEEIGFCQAQIEIKTRVGNIGIDKNSTVVSEKFIAVSSAEYHDSFATLHANVGEWVPKDNTYRFRRALGLNEDDVWRYSQAEQFTVIQRRARVPLDSAAYMDIALSNGYPLERVNISVKSKKTGKRKLLEFALLPEPNTLPAGQTGVRIDLRPSITKFFPETADIHSGTTRDSDLYLEEIYIFLPGEADIVARKQPLVSVGVVGDSDVSASKILTYSESPSYDMTKRVEVNLRPLHALGMIDFEEMKLSFLSQNATKPCAIEFIAARLVKFNYRPRIVLNQSILELTDRVHTAFESPIHDVNALVKIIGFLSIQHPRRTTSNFKVQQTGGLDIFDKAISSSSNRSTAHSAKTPGYLFTSSLAAPLGSGVAPDSSNKLQAKLDLSDPNPFRINWDISSKIGPQTILYVDALNAIRSDYVDVTVITTDGKSHRKSVRLNRPVQVTKRDLDIARLVIEMPPPNYPSLLELRNVILLESNTFENSGVLVQPQVRPVTLSPDIIDNDHLDNFDYHSGHLSGFVGETEKLKFSTQISEELKLPETINLKHQFSDLSLLSADCPLGLTLYWEKESFHKKVCQQVKGGYVSIPIMELVTDVPLGGELGRLLSIDWELSLSPKKSHLPLGWFSLDFSIGGWGYSLTTNTLINKAILNLDGKQLRAKNVRFGKKINPGKYPDLWVELENKNLKELLRTSTTIRFADHDYFELRALELSPSIPIEKEIWDQIVNPPPKSIWERFLILLKWSFVPLMLTVGINPGWAYRQLRLPKPQQFELPKQGIRFAVSWLIVAMLSYTGGVVFDQVNADNFCFTCGGLAVMFFLKNVLTIVQPKIINNFPSLAANIFLSQTTVYFTVSIVSIIIMAIFAGANLTALSEQIASVAFFSLLVGTAIEFISIIRASNSTIKLET